MDRVKVLLYSGGMDSWLIRRLWKPDIVLYVGTGSAYSKTEQKIIKDRAEPGVEFVNFFNLTGYEREDFIIPYRNVYLCLAALNEVEGRYPMERMDSSSRVVEICLGATAGDRVLDKSPKFVEKLSDLLTYLSAPQHWTGGKSQQVKVVIPYKDYTKRQLLREFCVLAEHELNCPTQEALTSAWRNSFSCYTPKRGYPCGQCKPCFRKTVAFVLEGYRGVSIRRYAMLAREYLEESGILRQIKEGTYGRAEEERDILEFMEVTKNW